MTRDWRPQARAAVVRALPLWLAAWAVAACQSDSAGEPATGDAAPISDAAESAVDDALDDTVDPPGMGGPGAQDTSAGGEGPPGGEHDTEGPREPTEPDRPIEPEEPAIPPEFLTCTTDEDCVVAWPGCCDACNGGEPLASRQLSAPYLVEHIDPDGTLCDGVACGELPCPPIRAHCKAGQCAVRFETNQEGGCSGMGTEDCDASPVCKQAMGIPVAEHCAAAPDAIPLPAGCVLSTACLPSATCARAEDALLALVFPDSCYPAGWTPCGASFCATAEPSCTQGQAPPFAEYCVRGEPVDEGELLAADTPVHLELRPIGCFSQTCTIVFEAECEAAMLTEDRLLTAGLYCLTLNSLVTCAGDCLGAKAAPCGTFELAAGLYTLQAGATKKSFTVPSIVPAGGFCVEVTAP